MGGKIRRPEPHGERRPWLTGLRPGATFRVAIPPLRRPSCMRDVVFWIAVLSCACGQAMIVRSALRARIHAAHANTPAGIAQPRASSELAWTLLPALVLGATLVITWHAIHAPAAVTMLDDVPAAAPAAPPSPR
jgi:hypothetical protein